MIVIDCTMAELQALLDGKSIPLEPQGPLMVYNPHAEEERPLTRLEKLKQAAGKSYEELLLSYCKEHLSCWDCPASVGQAHRCPDRLSGNMCDDILAAWLREDPALI